MPGHCLRELVRYRATGHDRRRAEAEMNRYEHFRVAVDGVPVAAGRACRVVALEKRFAVHPAAHVPYANNDRYPWTPSHDRIPVVEAPTGITFVGYENPPGVTTAERVAHFLGTDRAAWYHHVNLTAHDRGGHVIPWETPRPALTRAGIRTRRRPSRGGRRGR